MLAKKLSVSESQTTEAMPVLQTGIANIMIATPKSKAAATEALAQNISSDSTSIDTNVLSDEVDLSINTATMAANPVTVMATDMIAEDIGIGEAQTADMMPMIQTGVAQIMNAPDLNAKDLATENLISVLNTNSIYRQISSEQNT